MYLKSRVKCAQNISNAVMKNDQAYRSIASGDHHKNHHVIHFSQPSIDLLCRIYRMVNGTGCIEQNHGKDKNT